MSETKELAVRKYFKKDEIIQRFIDVIGSEKDARNHIGSVLVAVSQDRKLAACTHESILAQALRAATLRVSVDPALKQAALVAYGQKCTLIVEYKGLHDMAMRTGAYNNINVGVRIYEGMDVVEDPITGQHSVTGNKSSDVVVGWLSAFKMISKHPWNGIEKTKYMTLEEIHAHAEQYSPSYKYDDSPWKTATAKMERKTVFRQLIMHDGYIDPSDAAVLQEIREEIIEDGYPIIEIETEMPEQPTPSAADEIASLGYAVEQKGKGVVISTRSKLNKEAAKLGVTDLDLIDKIVAECDNNFGEAIGIIETQHVPPAESEG